MGAVNSYVVALYAPPILNTATFYGRWTLVLIILSPCLIALKLIWLEELIIPPIDTSPAVVSSLLLTLTVLLITFCLVPNWVVVAKLRAEITPSVISILVLPTKSHDTSPAVLMLIFVPPVSDVPPPVELI